MPKPARSPKHLRFVRGLHADGNERRYLGEIDGPALAKALWLASGNDLAALKAIAGATND